MIYRHKDTGQPYRYLFDAWCVDNQRRVAVYMQMETGRIFTRDCEKFDKKFELIEDDPERDIQPKVDF